MRTFRNVCMYSYIVQSNDKKETKPHQKLLDIYVYKLGQKFIAYIMPKIFYLIFFPLQRM